jgi:hypothetical protein
MTIGSSSSAYNRAGGAYEDVAGAVLLCRRKRWRGCLSDREWASRRRALQRIYAAAAGAIRSPEPTPLPQARRRSPRSPRGVSQELRILPDGTRICGVPNVSIFYMDSSGRTRSESNFGVLGPDARTVPTAVEIEDPVAGTLFYLDLVKHTAYRLHPSPYKPIQRTDHAAQPPFLEITRSNQSLRTHIFEGFPVEGTLQTTTATPLGGSQPVSVATEKWASLLEMVALSTCW